MISAAESIAAPHLACETGLFASDNLTLVSRCERGLRRLFDHFGEGSRPMLTTQSIRFAVAVFAAALSLLAASERSAPTQADWINALRQGGYVIVFRHGATHADQADTDPLNPSNVAAQRQLNDAGRAKAKEIGEAFRKLKIPVGQVHTSVFNRAVENG